MVRIVVKGNAQWSGGSSLSSLYRVTPLLTTRSSQCPLVGTETACFVRFPCDLMVFTGTTKKSENNCAFSTAFGFLRSISLVELFQILELPWLMWSVAGTSFWVTARLMSSLASPACSRIGSGPRGHNRNRPGIGVKDLRTLRPVVVEQIHYLCISVCLHV